MPFYLHLCRHRPRGRQFTLAYAVTSYGAQGVTVDTTHDLVDQGTTRAGLYVPGTRGRDSNTFYVVCQQAPDHHDPERIDRTALAVLTDILTRPVDRNTAAEIARRAGIEETRSLAWVGTQWDLLTSEYSRHRATDTLTRVLPADIADRLGDEPGFGRLMSALRSMELAGHDPQKVLTAVVGRRSLHDAVSISDVLRYRIRMFFDNGHRTPERAVRDGDWTTFAAPWAGPVGEYAQVLARAATARQIDLGERVAAEPPAWALAASTLGAPPADQMQQAEWIRRAGIVAAYRDLHAIPDTQLSIGEAPSRERAFHHALWRQALTALGHPADALDYATASNAELREMRAAWRRVEAWAPEFVAEDLHAARVAAEDYRRDAVIWRAGLDRNRVGSAEREVDERDLAAAEQLAAVSAARVEALERIQHVRTEWLDRHRDLHERHTFAGDELERRGLDRDAVATLGEQQELFTVRDGSHNTESHSGADTASTSGAHARSAAPAQQQLDLDGVPRANPSKATREQTDRTTETGPAAGTDGSTKAAAAAADPADTESDGYGEVFAQAERAAEQERQQPGLFDAQPAAADVAAAQPVHEGDPAGGRCHSDTAQASDEDESATEEAAVTIGQAARRAEIIAELRGELDARAAAAVAPQRRRTEPDDADTDVAPAREEATESRTDATQGHGLST